MVKKSHLCRYMCSNFFILVAPMFAPRSCTRLKCNNVFPTFLLIFLLIFDDHLATSLRNFYKNIDSWDEIEGDYSISKLLLERHIRNISNKKKMY